MQITTQPTSGSLFSNGSPFAQASNGNMGLFGLLMAIFSQNGGQLATGQILPTGTDTQAISAAQSQTQLQAQAQNLLLATTVATTTDGATPATPATTQTDALAAQAQQLLSLLQGLSQNPEISTELKSLLGDGQFDLEALQQRLAAMDDDARARLMSEMAALLQPALAVMPQQPTLPVTTDDLATVTATPAAPDAVADAPAAPAPAIPAEIAAIPDEAQPALTPEETPEAAIAAAPVKTDAAPQPVRKNKPNTATAQVEATVKETATPAVVALEPAAPEDNSAIKPEVTAKAAVEAAPQPVRQSVQAAASKPAETAPAQAQPVETTKAAASTQTEAAVKPVESAKATPKNTAAKSGDDAAATLLKELGQPATAQTTSTEKTQQTSFTDHLSQVKLSRTGAHVPVSDQIAIQMSKSVQQGQEKFTVRLSPAELGRIEIRVEMTADGRVSASFQVDQPATLDLLQRDQRGLERALSDAGLKADQGSLNFNLRNDNPQGRNPGQDGQQGQQAEPGFSLDGDMPPEALPAGILETTWYVGSDRLDVRV